MQKVTIFLAILCLFTVARSQEGKTVLMVVTDVAGMTEGQMIMQQHLEDLGMVVDPISEGDVTGTEGADYDLIFVHEAIGSSSVGAKFNNEPTPIMSTEFYIADDMGFAGGTTNEDYGQTTVDDPDLPAESFFLVDNPDHPILAGIDAGELEVYSEPAKMGWAAIQGDVSSIGSLSYDPTKSVFFTVELGAENMNGEYVPERRAYFFTFAEQEPFMTDLAWDLFARTVRWCLHLDPGAGVADHPASQPQSFQLNQNYPNPFNPGTTISYSLKKAGHVDISIYNSQGQKVATLVDQQHAQGQFSIDWNGMNDMGERAVSGIYFIKMTVEDFSSVVKAVLAR